MEHKNATYERLRDQVSAIDNAPDRRNRKLVWATAEHSLALARDADGRLEVFVTGEPLAATIKSVAEVLEHQVWMTDHGDELAANRLMFPFGEHFDQFSALLCIELLEHGLHHDPQAAFSAVEPLIDLALTRELMSDRVLTGLIGELALLEAILVAAPPTSASDLLRAWAGSAPSARDFQLGSVGIEHNTTQGTASIHHVEGVHQIELGSSNDGSAESALYLLSLGLGWVVDPNQGRSLPELVDSILNAIPDAGDRSGLLAQIRQYGGDAALGYDHAGDRGKPRYVRRFYFRFERLYDMRDDRLSLLTSAELAELKNVDSNSVTFRVVLGDRIRGMLNPTNGWQDLISKILESAGIEPV